MAVACSFQETPELSVSPLLLSFAPVLPKSCESLRNPVASSDNDMTTNPNFSPKAQRCSAAASHAAVRAATRGFQASTPNKKRNEHNSHLCSDIPSWNWKPWIVKWNWGLIDWKMEVKQPMVFEMFDLPQHCLLS